jgi:hypothetical protein
LPKDSVPSIGRKQTGAGEYLAQVDAIGLVDVENVNGRSAARAETHEPRAVPHKVATPTLPAWIKENDDPPGDEIAAAQVARFRKIGPTHQ